MNSSTFGIFLFLSFYLLLTACQTSGTGNTDNQLLVDTVITEIRDTVITFYPETYEEVVQVVISYDTVITPRSPE